MSSDRTGSELSVPCQFETTTTKKKFKRVHRRPFVVRNVILQLTGHVVYICTACYVVCMCIFYVFIWISLSFAKILDHVMVCCATLRCILFI